MRKMELLGTSPHTGSRSRDKRKSSKDRKQRWVINENMMSPWSLAAVVASEERAASCCRTAGRAGEACPWTPRSEAAGRTGAQLETSRSCLSCWTGFPCAGTLSETGGLQGAGGR